MATTRSPTGGGGSVGRVTDEELAKVFRRYDTNGDGKISAEEMGSVLESLGSLSSPEELQRMMAEIDSDSDGFIDFKEFAEFHRGGGADGLREAFEMYDADKNGLISSGELHLLLQRLGERCSVEDCARMIRSVDSDGDGYVSFDEFKRMINTGSTAVPASDADK